MRSNDYSTTEIFVDNFLLSTLSIMSTNSFSPTIYLSIYLSACIFQRFQQKSGESCSVIVAGNELFLIRHEHFIKKSCVVVISNGAREPSDSNDTSLLFNIHYHILNVT